MKTKSGEEFAKLTRANNFCTTNCVGPDYFRALYDAQYNLNNPSVS